MIIGKLVTNQVYAKSLVLDITIPIARRASIQANRRIFTNFDAGGETGILWINAVVGPQCLRSILRCGVGEGE